MWLLFFVILLLALLVDFFVLNGRKSHEVSVKESLTWTAVWVSLALLFNAFVWWHLSSHKAAQFFTAYLLEKSLSIDNIFVFLVIFSFFSIPIQYQRRVLLYGVLGAIVMRFFMIVLGIYLVHTFSWILYVFGVFLICTGIKMFFFSKKKTDLNQNIVLKAMKKYCRTTEDFVGDRFFVKRNSLWYATPLFLALVLIEISDLIFAIDSIPAVFSITSDTFIVFTSNIFAILGLRALYFLFAKMAKNFTFLKYVIACILILVGFKLLI